MVSFRMTSRSPVTIKTAKFTFNDQKFVNSAIWPPRMCVQLYSLTPEAHRKKQQPDKTRKRIYKRNTAESCLCFTFAAQCTAGLLPQPMCRDIHTRPGQMGDHRLAVNFAYTTIGGGLKNGKSDREGHCQWLVGRPRKILSARVSQPPPVGR